MPPEAGKLVDGRPSPTMTPGGASWPARPKAARCLILRQCADLLGGVAPVEPRADPLHGEADVLDAVGVGDPEIALAIGAEARAGDGGDTDLVQQLQL